MGADFLAEMMAAFVHPSPPVAPQAAAPTGADSQEFAGLRNPAEPPESKQRRRVSQDSQNSQADPRACETAPLPPGTATAIEGGQAADVRGETAPPGRRILSPPLADPVPDGGRALLGWLDILGPLSTEAMAAAMHCPRGAAVGLAMRLRDLGLIARTGDAWRLTRKAETVALLPASEGPEPVNACGRPAPPK